MAGGTRSVSDAARELQAAVAMLRAGGALVRSSHANLSVRLDAGRVAMTRRSTVEDLEAQASDALCVVDLDGRVLDGEVAPAMREVITMHTRLYQGRSDVGAVIHTHAPRLTAFAVAHQPLDLVYEPMLRVGVTQPVPVVPWAPRGSRESVQAIMGKVDGAEGVKAVLLANHGVLAFAEDAQAAARVMVTLEEAAGLAIAAAALGGAKALPARAADDVRSRRSQFASASRA